MKLDFNFQIKNLDGVDFEGENNHCGKILANYLQSLNKGNSMKLWDWAQTVWKKQPLEIDKTDSDVLKELVETGDLPVITKAQIIEAINKAK